ncbi:AraC family transcriptional regulator [Bacillus sp. DNRA2]|uniref:helix-turn-helix domain-containing protein n=1 Tax=Bacillus sp. DNRA2 TaxID=2723053 RepID=UPI00145E9399|nr:helix-turn-helix domain-containing protein [Bacillus sp. DNRA2]NMD71671.1 AraC family transcriptional regulator [Bacillus sp. DNRA2]
MLTNFNRAVELVEGLETDYTKLLYYDLSPMHCDYKSYENTRLCTIIEGCKHVSINKDIQFTYKPGQFIVLPPHANVHMDIDIPTKALVFELNDNLLKKVTEKISIEIDADYNLIKENRFFLGKINAELGKCLSKLTNVSAMFDKNKEFLIDLYAQELVYHLVQIKGIQQIINLEHHHPITQSIKYIQDNIKQPISICQLANDLNMSEANFCNSFKKIIGITPKEYITNLKLTQAKNLLEYHNVTEVAYELGYENISHFIALFKNKYGITPKHYKSIGKVPVVYKF